ncbi:hypothetical protein [Aeromicrobium sp. Root495]|nr:hypothetical protein [Aeromicrobium sp. Root495]
MTADLGRGRIAVVAVLELHDRLLDEAERDHAERQDRTGTMTTPRKISTS